MEDKLVSVIMPARNAAMTIGESINSVIAQTYGNWELVVVDDCSTDNTVEIVEAFRAKDKRIKLFHTGKSEGKPYMPKNLGIKSAQGRFIAFLDSDDRWLPEKLERQLPLFEDKDVAIVFSNYKKFSDGTGTSETDKQRIVKSASVVRYSNAVYGNPIGNLTAVYDTSKTGKMYFADAGHEDYILWLMILKNGFKALNTNTVEAEYRVRPNSVSSHKDKAAKWTWNIYRNILGMNLFRASFCFLSYTIKAIVKYIK